MARLSAAQFGPWWHVAEAVGAGLRLALRRRAAAARIGERRATGTGSAMEFHDFRAYQPGDDLRQVDWNAVARTGDFLIRTREAEVTPTVEIVVDTSASMALDNDKLSRTREVAALLCVATRAASAHPKLLLLVDEVQPAVLGFEIEAALDSAAFRSSLPLADSVTLKSFGAGCGLRVVVSDFLTETAPAVMVNRFRQNCAQLVLIELLSSEDLKPNLPPAARLVDAESQVTFESDGGMQTLSTYMARLEAHRSSWQLAVAQAGAERLCVNAATPLLTLAHTSLATLFET